jgi:hypothetical protein
MKTPSLNINAILIEVVVMTTKVISYKFQIHSKIKFFHMIGNKLLIVLEITY